MRKLLTLWISLILFNSSFAHLRRPAIGGWFLCNGGSFWSGKLSFWLVGFLTNQITLSVSKMIFTWSSSLSNASSNIWYFGSNLALIIGLSIRFPAIASSLNWFSTDEQSSKAAQIIDPRRRSISNKRS